MTTFRDSSIVIIETSRTVVRAGLGLYELLRTPTIDIPARVGIRASLAPDSSVSQTPVNGRPAYRLGDSLDVGGGPSASTSRAPSAMPPSNSGVRVTDYLVGPQLDEALAAGQDIVVSWPFADGQIRDWTQAEALWKYALLTGLGIRRVQNESPVLLSIFAGLSREGYERISQVFFERFNVAAFSMLDRAMAQLYAANALSGVVVDIGTSRTDVTPVYDGFPVHLARTSVKLGTDACEAFLAHVLRTNTSIELTDAADLRALAQHTWRAGLVRVPTEGEAARDAEDEGVTDIAAVLVAGKEKAVIESGMKKRANAKASAAELARAKEIEALDLVTTEFRGVEVTLGKERHRFCEPLFDPGVMAGVEGWVEENLGDEEATLDMPLQTAVGHAVGLTEAEQRQYIWNGLFVTGDVASYVKGITAGLHSYLLPYVLSNPDQHNEVQARQIRTIKVPDYFAEFREKGDGLAAFLGTSIVAKITFHDGKNFTTKADYAERGPKAVLEMSPSLF
ncbi:actin-like ATPase domain-containing protein [Auriscalpium vulgare]|uniref:Actin-like ATPase domain-containing protein n=1 Tax=Auriscalpium vulgare TaxID=40419 RepID=A0ACB8RLC0_9AGAM|nr:actin-like ATPase domain-containing protein [Auriscalpium vulgare]